MEKTTVKRETQNAVAVAVAGKTKARVRGWGRKEVICLRICRPGSSEIPGWK